ncbi:MAG: D-alanyl-D-alanine carboxypeptidase/D-alanyl-D-alanine-endopeptidase [Chitinophagaceae bacterium]
MIKIVAAFILVLACSAAPGQSIGPKMETLWTKFIADEQLQYALAGICVMDTKTGQIVFEKNSNIGFAPASTQKILTTVAAYEALGSGFMYQTKIGYTGSISNRKMDGDLVIEASGDPTFGSWRYTSAKEDVVLKKISDAVKKSGIQFINGNIVATGDGFDINPIPDNWTWGDMGNYYGAGHWALNWRENQYDLYFKSGKTKGDTTAVIKVDPEESIIGKLVYNEVKTGDANTGDGSSIYAAPFSPFKLVQGNISSNENNFKVSGSFSLADMNCLSAIAGSLQKSGITITGKPIPPSAKIFSGGLLTSVGTITNITTLTSPNLDSIVYWFLKKSINLYGEALVRTIGLQKKGFGSTDNGLEWIDSFYKANNFDTRAIHMTDGSGLAPTNRTTPLSFVKALKYAQGRSWYPAFYDALPVYNGMKLKSGTIHRTKCFAGYHNGYIVSLMVNNYNGSSSGLVDKMFTLLDGLK